MSTYCIATKFETRNKSLKPPGSLEESLDSTIQTPKKIHILTAPLELQDQAMTEGVPGFFSYQLISFLFEFRKFELGFLSFANTKILTDRKITLKSKLISSSNKLKVLK